MMMIRSSRILPAAAAAVLAVGAPTGPAALAAPAPQSSAAPAVRVNQVGYLPSSAKFAFVMLAHRVPAVRFSVRSSAGTVLNGTTTRDLGPWNANYGAVYRLDFTRLHRTGAYRIQVDAPGRARSPWFDVAEGPALYDRLIGNGVRYFTSERDGTDVDHSVLARRPANLTDRRATVYAAPHYDSDDTLIDRTLHPIGGPVDVEGGWFDAGGGYEKFGYTAAYTDALMSTAALQNGDPKLRAEAQFGLRWLEKLWDPVHRIAYMQVGIGSGGESIAGDYDYWFLPQREDRLGAQPGDADYYVEYRPVFAAAAPGQPISPGLAGRYAAAFALGARLVASDDPARARHLLYLARTVYAQARTHNVHGILTAYPHDFYPGTQWKSDMLWGSTEITLAGQALHASPARIRADLAQAGHWGRAYLAQGHPAGGDTFNLYDDGAVAEADLIHAQRLIGGPSVLAASKLLRDLAAQLRLGERAAAGDPFEPGLSLGAGDATPHAFGLFVTAALYRRYGGDGRFDAFAQQQLNFTLGANAWGTSFVVGAGHTFPHCLQSEIANLSGSLTGHGDNIQLGAVGDGPSAPDNFVGLGTVDGMRACGSGQYSTFDTAQAAYEDNVVAWPSVEPADDYSMDALLAFVLARG